jgi:hypothetical protein
VLRDQRPAPFQPPAFCKAKQPHRHCGPVAP